jgi:lysozyme
MRASRHCAEMIAGFEGGQGPDGKFHPYWDSAGNVWTIGYGHTGGVSHDSKPLTKAEAEALLEHDLNHAYAPAVAGQLAAYGIHTFNRNRFDALVSLAYNLGPGILAPVHTVGAELKAHHWRKAADAILLYDFAGGRKLAGLTRRREAERALFLKRTSVKA